ncbi:unnamed protein product [Closterium sp. NIES-65]|nr:unnamed protein product [Closterium sp. NIES-65]
MGPQDDVSLSFDTNPNLTFPQHRRPQGTHQQQPMPFPPQPGMGPGPGLGALAPPPQAGPRFGGQSQYDGSGGLFGQNSFEDELPLLEELGINIPQILRKTASALNPIRINIDLYDDGDLSGPLIFCVLFGLCQLMHAKVHFGVVLGWSVVASTFIYTVFNLLVGARSAQAGLDLYRCCSIFGYGLLPMVLYSAISIFFPRRGVLTAVAAAVAIVWCTRTAASLLVAIVPQADDVRALIAFMCIVTYFCFALLVLF